MNQRTHAWLAIRAIALLEDAGESPNLIKLLKPFVRTTAIGCWIPDLADSKKGGGDIDYHIFKMKPYTGSQKERFITDKETLFKQVGSNRQVKKFIQKWGTNLDDEWWNTPFKANPKPGEHLANRAMALTTAITDQLILGDPAVASLVPGKVSFASKLDPNARTRREEIATYFFMLSHFLADSVQPCHCDARVAFGYSKGLHKEMEADWSKIVGTYFEKKKLLVTTDSPNKVLAAARGVDEKFSLSLPTKIPKLPNKVDTWLEIVRVCRASFVVANILLPETKIAYSSKKLTTYDEVFKGINIPPELRLEFNRMTMHDAVINIAIIWKSIWSKFE